MNMLACPKCDCVVSSDWDYCPECGATMEGAVDFDPVRDEVAMEEAQACENEPGFSQPVALEPPADPSASPSSAGPDLQLYWIPGAPVPVHGRAGIRLQIQNSGPVAVKCRLRLDCEDQEDAVKLGNVQVAAGAVTEKLISLRAHCPGEHPLGEIRLWAEECGGLRRTFGYKVPAHEVSFLVEAPAVRQTVIERFTAYAPDTLNVGVPRGAIERAEPKLLPLAPCEPLRGILVPDAPRSEVVQVRVDLISPDGNLSRFRLWFSNELYFGRQLEKPGGKENRVVMRWLPCRSQKVDPEHHSSSMGISSTAFCIRANKDQVHLHSLSKSVRLQSSPMPAGKSQRLVERDRFQLELGCKMPPLELELSAVEALPEDPLRGLGYDPDLSCSYVGMQSEAPPEYLRGVRVARKSNLSQVTYALVFRDATFGSSSRDLCPVPGLPEASLRIVRIEGRFYFGVLENLEIDEDPRLRGILRPILAKTRLILADGWQAILVPESGSLSGAERDLFED